MKTKTLLAASLLAIAQLCSAQNTFPTATDSDPTIDGGSIRMVKPVTTSGWARGLFFHHQNANDAERWAGVGLYGTGSTAKDIFIGHGQDPWSSTLGMHINDNGNTGVGVRYPTERFEVKGTAFFRNTNYFGTDKNNKIGIISYDNGQDKFLIRGTAGHKLSLGADNENDQMVIDLAGDVGIGTTSPLAKLDVTGTSQSVMRLSTDNPAYYITLEANRNAANTFNLKNAGQEVLGAKTLNGKTPVFLNGRNGIALSAGTFSVTDNSIDLYVASNGNVGIGTLDPTKALHVTGSARVESYLTLGANGNNSYTASGLILESHHNFRGTGTFSRGQTAEWFWGNPHKDHDGTFIIARGAQGTGLPLAQKANALFTMSHTGNVSIGTIDVYPDYKLTVAGKGRFIEVKVQPQIEWADYVFKDDYNLRSLSEVKDYIDKNGHLPDIPSAEEVKKNGFNLGEMDANLLRKIEELTLYMIANEEEKKLVKQENELLKKELGALREMMEAIVSKN